MYTKNVLTLLTRAHLETYRTSGLALWSEDRIFHRKRSFIRKGKKSLWCFPQDFKERLSLKSGVKVTLSRNFHGLFLNRRNWGLTCILLGFQSPGLQLSCYDILPYQDQAHWDPLSMDRHQLTSFLRVLESLALLCCPLLLSNYNDCGKDR